jgi:vacuolar-type H+-ATPase subunit I/STV1
MTDAQATAGSRPTATSYATPDRTTAWVGWIWFAAVMMIMVGAFSVIYGLVALFNDTYYTVGPQGLLVFDITQWGWVHLIVGLVAVGTGFALLTGAMWARVLAVVIASINAIAQLLFMSANPAWALIAITFDLLVIWAVVVHGGEVKESESAPY